MKVGIIGLGLMGGSFSMDIKNIYKKSKIFGLDSSDSNYQMSLKLKLTIILVMLEPNIIVKNVVVITVISLKMVQNQPVKDFVIMVYA